MQRTLYHSPFRRLRPLEFLLPFRRLAVWRKKQFWVVDTWCAALYNKVVIKTFKDDNTQKIYQRERSRKLPPDIQQVALRKLRMINNAISINDLRIPRQSAGKAQWRQGRPMEYSNQ